MQLQAYLNGIYFIFFLLPPTMISAEYRLSVELNLQFSLNITHNRRHDFGGLLPQINAFTEACGLDNTSDSNKDVAHHCRCDVTHDLFRYGNHMGLLHTTSWLYSRETPFVTKVSYYHELLKVNKNRKMYRINL